MGAVAEHALGPGISQRGGVLPGEGREHPRGLPAVDHSRAAPAVPHRPAADGHQGEGGWGSLACAGNGRRAFGQNRKGYPAVDHGAAPAVLNQPVADGHQSEGVGQRDMCDEGTRQHGCAAHGTSSTLHESHQEKASHDAPSEARSAIHNVSTLHPVPALPADGKAVGSVKNDNKAFHGTAVGFVKNDV
eukprot:1158208-Pelagomonas_calceolata.AAC.6